MVNLTHLRTYAEDIKIFVLCFFFAILLLEMEQSSQVYNLILFRKPRLYT